MVPQFFFWGHGRHLEPGTPRAKVEKYFKNSSLDQETNDEFLVHWQGAKQMYIKKCKSNIHSQLRLGEGEPRSVASAPIAEAPGTSWWNRCGPVDGMGWKLRWIDEKRLQFLCIMYVGVLKETLCVWACIYKATVQFHHWGSIFLEMGWPGWNFHSEVPKLDLAAIPRMIRFSGCGLIGWCLVLRGPPKRIPVWVRKIKKQWIT